MRLEAVNLEEYQNLNDEGLKWEILQTHKEIKNIKREQSEDRELQAAISLAESLKVKYTLRLKQQQKLLKTLELLSEMRGL